MNVDPIVPFEPVLSDEIPDDAGWTSQIKWDGVRVLTYFDDRKVRLFNRKRNERTLIFPELTDIKSYTSARSVILDGEVIALNADGKPSFHEVMRRDGVRRLERVDIVRHTVPIYYMVFDVIFYNGDWIHHRPLKERLDLLSRIIEPNPQVQLVSGQQDGRALFDTVKEHNMEGIVSKRLNSRYVFGGKNDDWRKIKNYKDLVAVIGGVTYRSGIVNSLLLGLYDNRHRFYYIGHAGTGKLTGSDWDALTRIVEPLKINRRPFVNRPERSRHAQWIKPSLTVKVQYIEWSDGHTLRQPSIQAFVDQDPRTCMMRTEILASDPI
ncbi:DNA ligase [Sporolactobacillus sp. THM7-7]|nr:DNA ligase [Sporolactobacillus sp. THM7-7]